MSALPSRTVAGYARYSPDDSAKVSIEMQEREIDRLCASRGWGFHDFFVDADMSGATPPEERPGLSRLLAALESHEVPREFDTVVTYEESRLARDQFIFWSLIDRFHKAGATYLTVMNPNEDSKTANFTLMGGVKQSMASYYRQEISIKTKSALAGLRDSGKAVSRPPLGFRLVLDNPEDPKHSHKHEELDDLGKKALAILSETPKMKPKDFNALMGFGENDYMTGWHLRKNLLIHLGTYKRTNRQRKPGSS